MALVVGTLMWRQYSAENSSSELHTRLYRIQPAFITEEADTGKIFPAPKDQRPLQQKLEEDAGITFPEGAMVSNMGLSFSGLMLRNTEKNHAKLVRYLDLSFPGKWNMHENE